MGTMTKKDSATIALPERMEAGLLKATYAGVPVRPEDLIELRGRYNRHAELIAAARSLLSSIKMAQTIGKGIRYPSDGWRGCILGNADFLSARIEAAEGGAR